MPVILLTSFYIGLFFMVSFRLVGKTLKEDQYIERIELCLNANCDIYTNMWWKVFHIYFE